MNMRDLINICETISPDLKSKIAAAVADTYTPDEDAYGSTDHAIIVPKIFAQIEQLFLSGQATLYRVLNIPEAVLQSIKAGQSIGPHDSDALTSWTSDFSQMDFYSTYADRVYDDEEHGAKLFMFTAIVPFTAVALEETVRQRIAIPWEQEIVTQRGHAIRCVDVAEVDNYGHLARRVRRDLRGAMLTT